MMWRYGWSKGGELFLVLRSWGFCTFETTGLLAFLLQNLRGFAWSDVGLGLPTKHLLNILVAKVSRFREIQSGGLRNFGFLGSGYFFGSSGISSVKVRMYFVLEGLFIIAQR